MYFTVHKRRLSVNKPPLYPYKKNGRSLILILSVTYCQDQGYSTDLLDPTQVESKNTFSQIQWPVPSINAESVDIFLGEE